MMRFRLSAMEFLDMEKFTSILCLLFVRYTRNEMGLKLGLKPLFSWFSAVSGGFRGDLDPKTRNLDPA
jgi:hypothetical protein